MSRGYRGPRRIQESDALSGEISIAKAKTSVGTTQEIRSVYALTNSPFNATLPLNLPDSVSNLEYVHASLRVASSRMQLLKSEESLSCSGAHTRKKTCGAVKPDRSSGTPTCCVKHLGRQTLESKRTEISILMTPLS